MALVVPGVFQAGPIGNVELRADGNPQFYANDWVHVNKGRSTIVNLTFRPIDGSLVLDLLIGEEEIELRSVTITGQFHAQADYPIGPDSLVAKLHLRDHSRGSGPISRVPVAVDGSFEFPELDVVVSDGYSCRIEVTVSHSEETYYASVWHGISRHDLSASDTYFAELYHRIGAGLAVERVDSGTKIYDRVVLTLNSDDSQWQKAVPLTQEGLTFLVMYLVEEPVEVTVVIELSSFYEWTRIEFDDIVRLTPGELVTITIGDGEGVITY